MRVIHDVSIGHTRDCLIFDRKKTFRDTKIEIGRQTEERYKGSRTENPMKESLRRQRQMARFLLSDMVLKVVTEKKKD